MAFNQKEIKRIQTHFAFQIHQKKTPTLEECREFVFLENTFSKKQFKKRSAKSVQDKVRSLIMEA